MPRREVALWAYRYETIGRVGCVCTRSMTSYYHLVGSLYRHKPTLRRNTDSFYDSRHRIFS
jgi:hypothetical protein